MNDLEKEMMVVLDRRLTTQDVGAATKDQVLALFASEKVTAEDWQRLAEKTVEVRDQNAEGAR